MSGSERHDGLLGVVDAVDPDVEVPLLGMVWIRPRPRYPVVDSLERQLAIRWPGADHHEVAVALVH